MFNVERYLDGGYNAAVVSHNEVPHKDLKDIIQVYYRSDFRYDGSAANECTASITKIGCPPAYK